MAGGWRERVADAMGLEPVLRGAGHGVLQRGRAFVGPGAEAVERGREPGAALAALLVQALDVEPGPLERGAHRCKRGLFSGRIVIGTEDVARRAKAWMGGARTVLCRV